jgi:hypothetical protein
MSGFSSDLISLRNDSIKLKEKLEECLPHELPAYQNVLNDCIVALEDALNHTQLPEYYRVAIVGRFKVGKSSFVNKLANERLAGVETSPETAAISIFRYAESTYANIELINKEDWDEMRERYSQDKNDPSIKRYSSFATFNDRTSKKDSDSVDLSKLEAQWLKPGGHIHRINASDWKNKDGKKTIFKRHKAIYIKPIATSLYGE